jgi:UDP-2,3-diacylglucosamine hydrolase
LILFISDLHLSPRSPGATALFLAFLAGRARQAEALYILGDLFEAWIGDDDIDEPYNAGIVAALRAASDSGLRISLMHGNRDFLLGAGFADSRWRPPDRRPLHPVHRRMAVRALPTATRSASTTPPTWPSAPRCAIRNGRRPCSPSRWPNAAPSPPTCARSAKASQRGKDNPYTDLQSAATEDFLRAHGYATFIHGHTHQPATHDHIVDGIHVERWVLADWHEDRGECLVWDGERLSREAV